MEHAKKLLHAVFDTLSHDAVIDGNDLSKMSEATQTALYALYHYVKPTSGYETGLVCDANLRLAALELFDNRYNELSTWQRCTFWHIKVDSTLAKIPSILNSVP